MKSTCPLPRLLLARSVPARPGQLRELGNSCPGQNHPAGPLLKPEAAGVVLTLMHCLHSSDGCCVQPHTEKKQIFLPLLGKQLKLHSPQRWAQALASKGSAGVTGLWLIACHQTAHRKRKRERSRSVLSKVFVIDVDTPTPEQVLGSR